MSTLFLSFLGHPYEQAGCDTGCLWTGPASELTEHLNACKWGYSITCPVPECSKHAHLQQFANHMCAEHPGISPTRVFAENFESLHRDIETAPDFFMIAMEKLKQEGNPSLIVQIMRRHLSSTELGCLPRGEQDQGRKRRRHRGGGQGHAHPRAGRRRVGAGVRCSRSSGDLIFSSQVDREDFISPSSRCSAESVFP